MPSSLNLTHYNCAGQRQATAFVLCGSVTVFPLVSVICSLPFALLFQLLWFSLAYEILKLGEHDRWGRWARVALAPGMWLQRLTALPPDMQQLEVACAAARAVVKAETSHGKKLVSARSTEGS